MSMKGRLDPMVKLQSPNLFEHTHSFTAEKLGDYDEATSNHKASEKSDPGSVPRVLEVLTAVLEHQIARNQSYVKKPVQNLTIFHGLRAPSITISRYLERIFKHTNCSPSCFVMGYIFIDRLVHRQPDLPVTSLNVHRLLITSVTLATKILDDEHFDNAFLAMVGGIKVSDLNRMELELLFRLDFKLFVAIPEFESYCLHLQKEACVLSSKVERNLPLFHHKPSAELPIPSEESPIYKSRLEFVLNQPFLTTSNSMPRG